jgi:hypothetical protein
VVARSFAIRQASRARVLRGSDDALYRARLAARCRKAGVECWDWPWSSLRAHLSGRDDALVIVAPLFTRLGRIGALIDTESEPALMAQLRAAESTGRSLSGGGFRARLEQIVERRLRRQKPGRKAAMASATEDLFGENGLRRTDDVPGNQGNM